jgi:hypothetical protein
MRQARCRRGQTMPLLWLYHVWTPGLTKPGEPGAWLTAGHGSEFGKGRVPASARPFRFRLHSPYDDHSPGRCPDRTRADPCNARSVTMQFP